MPGPDDILQHVLRRLGAQRGQTSVEWVGLAFVIVALVGALAALMPDVATAVVHAIRDAIHSLG